MGSLTPHGADEKETFMTTATVTETAVEPEEISEALALEQMEAGFNGISHPSVDQTVRTISDEEPVVETGDTPAETPVEMPVEERGEVKEPIVAQTEPPAEKVEPPTIDPEQLRHALDVLQTVPELKKAIGDLRAQAFGKMGSLEEVLKRLQETTPLGQEIKVEESDLEELREEFPATTKALAPALTRILKKYKGTGVAPTPIDEEAIVNRAVKISDQIVEQRIAMAILSREHKDWRDVVGLPDSQTEFRTWLKAKGADIESKVLSSNDVDLLSETLTEFKKAKVKPKPKQEPAPVTSVRTQRLAEAVQPRGGQRPPTPKAKTPEEQFQEGFDSGPGGSVK